jgi:hypothetical protein
VPHQKSAIYLICFCGRTNQHYFEYIADEVLSASHVNLNNEEVEYFANSLRQNVINTLLISSNTGGNILM